MTRYLTVDDIIIIHQILINEFGGIHGLRDRNALESAVMRIQVGYYKNIFEQAAALMESLAQNHPFIDGNKRIAFFGADIFLRINGYYIGGNNEETYQFFMSLFKKNEFKFNNLLTFIKQNSKKLENK